MKTFIDYFREAIGDDRNYTKEMYKFLSSSMRIVLREGV